MLRRQKKIISSENGGKNAIEAKFPCVICRNNVGSNASFVGVGCIRDLVVLEVN